MSERLKKRLNEIIFGTDTGLGRGFDVALISMILLSVLALTIDSIDDASGRYSQTLYHIEWFFTIIFTVEYCVRIYCSVNRWGYARSFYGVVDLLSVLPTYLSLLYPGANYLLVIRLMRVLRVFRVLKLVRYLSEANVLMRALFLSRRKIFVFFTFVLILAIIFGSLMYLVEGGENGFTSIPKSVYWTIVTITTVGYGDITPQTTLGQIISSFAMLIGYSIIAVPTGILTAELTQEIQKERIGRMCSQCSKYGHERDATFCKYCGSALSIELE